jgi:cytochrome c5
MLSGCAEPGAGGATHPGEETYNRFCFSCHAAGIADAPKFGDAAAWAPRIAKGEALLLRSTREGIAPGMPAMGLCLSCSDAELAAAIDYMVSATQ